MKISVIFNFSVSLFFLLSLSACQNIEKEYYNNGMIKSTFYLENGLLNGKKSNFSEDGKLESEIFFVKGKKDGFERIYFENGQIKSEAEYINGLKNGDLNIYYLSGSVEYSAKFKSGEKTDTSFYFDQDYVLKEMKIYGRDGKIAYVRKFDDQGELLFDTVIPIIEVSRDTIQYGNKVQIQIETTFQLTGDLAIEFGKKDRDDFVRDSTYYFRGNETKMTISIVPQHIGLNEYYIKVLHIPKSEDDLTANGVITEVNVFTFSSKS